MKKPNLDKKKAKPIKAWAIIGLSDGVPTYFKFKTAKGIKNVLGRVTDKKKFKIVPVLIKFI